MTDKIFIDPNKLDFLQQDLIFKLFGTSLLLSDEKNRKGNKLCLNLVSNTKINTEKAKKFINSICYPEITERIKIDKESADILRSGSFISNLIEEYQILIELFNNELILQGDKKGVNLVKNNINVEKIRLKEPQENDDDDDVILLKDSYELFDEAISKPLKPNKNLNKYKKSNDDSSKNDLIVFEQKKSSLNDDYCEIINFVPSENKASKLQNNSASLTEYAHLFNMDFDKDAEKLNKVKRIDKLISVMPDDQKAFAINHVKNYQNTNAKKPNTNEEDDLIFFLGKNSASDNKLANAAPNTNGDLIKSSERGKNSNQMVKFQPKNDKTRARSRAKSRAERDNSGSKNAQINQNSLHARSKSSNPVKKKNNRELRHIIIDGSNVAREHGKLFGKFFSCKGIKIAVDYFLNRGHDNIYALVPRFRRGNSDKECPTRDPEILDELEEKGFLKYTPSRYVDKKLIVSYDDRFILDAALNYDGIIVSNDNYRDIINEKPEWKKLVDKNLLLFSFIGDFFKVADDPMGRHGPKLDEFLSKPSDCIKSVQSSSILTSRQCPSSNDLTQVKQVQKKKKNRTEEREQLILQLKNIFPNSENNIRSLVYEYKDVQDVSFFIEKLKKRN